MSAFYKELNFKRTELILDYFELMKQSKLDDKVHDTFEKAMTKKKRDMELFSHELTNKVVRLLPQD